MVRREKANYLIQSVSHALDVIEELCKSGAEVGVTELSKRLKLHKNNVFRLLATLELRGYVEQNKDSEDYRLGVKCLQLGQAFVSQSNLVARAYPLLRALSDSIGETVSLATIQNGQVQYPVTIDSKKAVKVSSRVGVSFHAKASAVGRLLTAQLPDAVLAEMLASNTPQDAAIKNQLSELRSSGAIIDKGVTEADVVTIARIVRGFNNEAVAAIEVLIPQYRAKVEQISSVVDETVLQLSQALGSVRSTLSGAIEREVSASQTNVVSAATLSPQVTQSLLGRINK